MPKFWGTHPAQYFVRHVVHSLVLASMLLFSSLSLGQGISPNVEVVSLQKGDQIQLLSHARLLEDVEGSFSWQQALAQNEWLDIKNNDLNLGITDSSYWFQVNFTYSEPQTRVFQIAYPLLDHVDFYLIAQNQLINHEATGDHWPLSSRAIQDKDFVFSHYQEDDQVLTLLLRVKTQGTMVLPLNSVNIELYAQNKTIENIAYGIYFGITFAMFLYNFMLFIYLKDRTYLYYCAFVFIIFISAISYTGHGFYWLWPEHSQLNTFMAPLSAALGFLAATLFMGSFLQMKKRGEQGRKVLGVSIALSILVILASILLSYSMSIKVIALVQLILTAVFLTYSISLWRKGVLEAKYFTLAWISFIIGNMISSTRVLGVLPSNSFTAYANLYGNVIEMLMLSMGLAYRFEKMREVQAGLSRELRLAQQDAIKNLEKYRDLFQYSPVGLFQFERKYNQFKTNKKINFLMNKGEDVREFLKNTLSFGDYKNLIKLGEIKDRLLKMDGDRFYSLSLFTKKDHLGKVVEIEGTLLDISEQKQAEVIRIDSEKEKLNTLTQLVFGISHQFNTPLGVMVATDELIQESLTSIIRDIEQGQLKKGNLMQVLTNMQDALSLSSTNTHIMAAILKDLRYSINTRSQLNLSDIKTATLFEDLFGYFKSQLSEQGKECDLNINIMTNGVDLITSDYDILSDVILRLFSNSYNHAYSEYASLGEITIRLEQDERFYFIEYFDDGRGLEEAERDNIFIPFFTGNSRKKDNSGLGMYILHNQIVKVMQGKIELLSPVKGFGLEIQLPKHYDKTGDNSLTT